MNIYPYYLGRTLDASGRGAQLKLYLPNASRNIVSISYILHFVMRSGTSGTRSIKYGYVDLYNSSGSRVARVGRIQTGDMTAGMEVDIDVTLVPSSATSSNGAYVLFTDCTDLYIDCYIRNESIVYA